ncbi:heme-degrading domain-containing protein [Microbacterium aoyamense]|uniref:Heme-degrading domain-containing protein n=1 Tax=Microbacterium aoyamense TaxID=344166 RepID=A0ABN2PBP0_9MICO|nr:heme-binding protein [Microbacterium aoyamense]
MDEEERVRTLEKVRGESALLSFSALDITTARKVGESIAAHCDRELLSVTIAVHFGQQRVFHFAFEGTSAENDVWVERKRNAVLKSGVSSFEVALTTRLAGENPAWLESDQFAAASGAVPLRSGDALVGTVALSGLTDAEESDHEAVMRGIRAYRGLAGMA